MNVKTLATCVGYVVNGLNWGHQSAPNVHLVLWPRPTVAAYANY